MGTVGLEPDKADDSLNRRLRYESALAECSKHLLLSEDPAAIDKTLEILLATTSADGVYVDRNYVDPELGLCARVEHSLEDPNTAPEEGFVRWVGGPYSELPTNHAALSEGRPSFIMTADLKGRERSIYESDGILSELNIPIFVAGQWLGSIAFAGYRTARRWDDNDVRVLQTTAEMIGTFWERTNQRQQIEETLEMLQRRLRLERALARSSRALLSSEPSAIDTALAALLEATEADFVFVDENYEDPELGTCTRITHWAEDSEAQPVDAVEEWWGGAYADVPTSYQQLSAGKPADIRTNQLSGEERRLYENDGVLSEMNIPILAGGQWRGSIAFTDYQLERHWDSQDIEFLTTAAEMIGAYWENQANRQRLEDLIRSKDQFIASVSHELRTPLTSVLGFAEVLTDGYERTSTAERQELLNLIRHGAQEVSWIVEDLLVFARADIGTLALAEDSINLKEQIGTVLREQIDDDGVEVAGEEVSAWADAVRVRQIARNLISNAYRYGGNDVAVELEAQNGTAHLRVTDNGAGIPEDLRELIFEPFETAHNSAGQPGSVGLGLAVSRQLARLMKGDLTYRYGGGSSVFELILPLREAN